MKQTIVARADLGMGAGKLAAQVAHAACQASRDAEKDVRQVWRDEGATKVVLRASDEDALFALADEAERGGLATAVIRDAGRTELEPGTVTALAVGPAADDRVNRVTGNLDPY